jgi:hypothetical protein
LLRGGGRTNKKGGKPVYFYEGLYRCTACNYEASADGPMVYIFTLVPIPGQSQPRRSMVVEPVRSPNSKPENSLHRLLHHDHEKRKNAQYKEMERHRRKATKAFGPL